MDLEYRDECVECMDIWGSQCHGHESPEMELCNNCNQYVPSSGLNFAGFCVACQQCMPVAEKR